MLSAVKRQVRFLILLLLSTLLLLSSNIAAASASPQLAEISANRLVFASSEYLPHYGTDLPKQGAVVEIVRRAFALRQLQIEVAFMPFARALYDTQQGQFAGIIAIWHTEERAENFLYSDPIYANQMVLFKRAGEFQYFNNLDALLNSEGTLGLVTGYAQNALLANSRFNKVSVATDEQIFSMLALRRVDLVPADLQNGLYLISKLPATQRKVQLDWITPALEHKPMHLAFPKNRPESLLLQQEFNLGLQALTASGELSQILAELLPEPVSSPLP
ncbi:substrate-binding periplasmic protein [Alishewanella longhuensis]